MQNGLRGDKQPRGVKDLELLQSFVLITNKSFQHFAVHVMESDDDDDNERQFLSEVHMASLAEDLGVNRRGASVRVRVLQSMCVLAEKFKTISTYSHCELP